ncbi:MAG: TraB/GumN family protein [Candidatus Diapherotrites archaeon]|nr:TraB/GumN family protein [Candidatus Diapherotrites archaeon]
MNVERIKLADKEVILLGTAHVSEESIEQVKQLIEEEKPDCIALELDKARFEQLAKESKWRETDIFSIIKTGKTYLLLFNLILAGMQRKIGKELGVKPGSEMLAAAELAARYDIPLALVDRDITITMKRALSKMGFLEKAKLLFELLLYAFGFGEKVTKDKVEELKNADVLSAVIEELSREFPSIKQVLVDERDKYIASKISKLNAKKVLAVIGAGHVAGIKKNLGKDANIRELEYVEKPRNYSLLLKVILPLALISIIAFGVYIRGPEFALKAFLIWFAINALFAALGAILVKAHWKSIVAAFCAAPFTSLHPAFAAGWFAGMVEAKVRPPRIKDFEEISNIDSLGMLSKNRFTHALVVTAVVNAASTIATFLSIYMIATML